ncbi:hypothetical protein [Arthrobacter sp. MYb227]|uniref:hypothetical protein n=1 Tax=Arthrobacter sp. MYb227 TaxID=1848601 RepID=UPI000CFD0737|nr:hypothetical protein [Arthrobacter sp. MYb227]
MRLIFEYDGDEIHLISRQLVDMALTGAQTPLEDHVGKVAEVRDASNKALASVPVTGMQTTAEVFPENPGDPIMRVALEHPQGAFTVVVPAPKAAASVALLDIVPASADREALPGPAGPPERRILGVFPLTEEGSTP